MRTPPSRPGAFPLVMTVVLATSGIGCGSRSPAPEVRSVPPVGDDAAASVDRSAPPSPFDGSSYSLGEDPVIAGSPERWTVPERSQDEDPVATSPAWEAIVAALGTNSEVFVLCTDEFCRNRAPCQRWEFAFLPPDENGAPRAEIGREESYADGRWGVERYELSPYGYPRNDGIDVDCVQWEGCGPTEVIGIGMCSSGCPSMERWYVESSAPGIVEFDTETFYSTLEGCLAASSASSTP